MHYTPHVVCAGVSIEHILREVYGGWMLRHAHANGASLFFIAVGLHLFRGLAMGHAWRVFEWCLGVLLLLLSILTAFVGYVLPWGQMSFWGATVITSLASALPVVGQSLVSWLWGGLSVENATLNRVGNDDGWTRGLAYFLPVHPSVQRYRSRRIRSAPHRSALRVRSHHLRLSDTVFCGPACHSLWFVLDSVGTSPSGL